MRFLNIFTANSYAHYSIVFIPRTHKTRFPRLFYVPCILIRKILVCELHGSRSQVATHFCCTLLK